MSWLFWMLIIFIVSMFIRDGIVAKERDRIKGECHKLFEQLFVAGKIDKGGMVSYKKYRALPSYEKMMWQIWKWRW